MSNPAWLRAQFRIALCLLVVSRVSVAAETLRVGDSAPALSITEWVKGEAVQLREGEKPTGGKVLVVEFWATWCAPCLKSIPRLSALQKKYGEDVTILGVTKPDRRNSLDRVKTFVAEQGEAMAYRIGFDGDGATYRAYMTAAGRSGIPSAFVVDREGRVAWHGHPAKLEPVLAAVVDGTYDLAAAIAKQARSARVSQLDATFRRQLSIRSFTAAAATAESLLALVESDARYLDSLARRILTTAELREHAAPIALEASERAHDLSKGENYRYLDTLALARFEIGDRDGALEFSAEAIRLAEAAGVSERRLASMQSQRARFER